MSTDDKVISIETFLDKLPRLDQKVEREMFYRGQSNYEFHLQPQVFRNEYSLTESEIYTHILLECASDFNNGMSHIDVLSKMQHYGVPTRLLDITSNPLVALFFACSGEKEVDGAVFVINDTKAPKKLYDSDTVTILASLPRFSDDDQNKIKERIIKDKKEDIVK